MSRRELSEADIIFNRASLALAKSQRLIASWLPPKLPQEATAKKTEEEREKEESELFSPTPELLGVGASLPPGQEAHSSPGIAKSSYLENKLRAQLLGKKASSTSRRNGAVSSHGPIKASTKCKSRDAKASSESEDEMGRTALWSKVVRSTTEIPDREELQPSAKAKVDVIPSNAEEMILRATSSKKRSSSYLDEVLMARSAKRKKKRNIRPND